MKRKLIALTFAAAVATAGAVAPVTGAFAKITEEPTSCTNGGGNQPQGQQPTCTGSGLTQNTEHQNPAGHAPPGQN